MTTAVRRIPRKREARSELELVATDGSRATLARETAGDVFRIYDGVGRLVIEHRADEGKSIVHAPSGDLELRADQGSIDLRARDDIRIRGDRAVTSVNHAELGAETVSLRASSVVSVVEALETQAERIVERARNVYREIEDLSQTRAGRLRTVVKTTFHVLSQRAFLKAKDDVKIKGDKIHLA